MRSKRIMGFVWCLPMFRKRWCRKVSWISFDGFVASGHWLAEWCLGKAPRLERGGRDVQKLNQA